MTTFKLLARKYRYLELAIFIVASSSLLGCTAPTTKHNSQVTANKAVANIINPITSTWVAVLPPATPPVFQGELEIDESEKYGGSIFYPGGDLITFGLSIAVHAAVGAGQQSEAMRARMAKANEILVPYQPVIRQMDITALLSTALSSLKESEQPIYENTAKSQGLAAPRIRLSAHYGMTQNQSAIALYLIGEVKPQSGGTFTHLVKVMSSASTGTPTENWLSNNGQGLKEVSAKLMQEGINLLAMDVRGKLPSKVEKTVRYQYGLDKYTERAGVIYSSCNRLVMRNLRNWIISVPNTERQCESTST